MTTLTCKGHREMLSSWVARKKSEDVCGPANQTVIVLFYHSSSKRILISSFVFCQLFSLHYINMCKCVHKYVKTALVFVCFFHKWCQLPQRMMSVLK
jgi:hypothetical protein